MRVVVCLLVPALAWASDCSITSVGLVPLNDLGQARYLGDFEGGLYPGGSNTPPSGHAFLGGMAANQVVPRNGNGNADPNGRIGLLAIGMSNARAEFDTFIQAAEAHPAVDGERARIVTGAFNGQDAENWTDPDGGLYDAVRDEVLAPNALTEAQVQVVWLKQANGLPVTPLPSPDADAYELLRHLGDIVRAVRLRYPNTQLVFLSSRIYAGYATSDLNPEPYAYESAFSVKWLIEAQIAQMNGAGMDPVAGDLHVPDAAPWVGWGPYLWADGLIPRSDGLVWECADFRDDGTHPSDTGAQKVANLLLDFFVTNPLTRDWFTTEAQDCPRDGDVDENGEVTPGDALLALEAYLELKTLTPCQTVRADVDGDPGVTPNDALEIFNEFLGG